MSVLGSEIDDHNDKIKAADSNFTDLTSKVTAPATIAQHLQTVDAQIKIESQLVGMTADGTILNKKFADLKAGTTKLSDQLDAINKAYDASTTGVYLQDKIGALLNSKLFCETVNRHCISKEVYAPGRDAMKEIFPDMSDKNARGGAEQRARTWDISNKKRVQDNTTSP